jgi:hypothetical protein
MKLPIVAMTTVLLSASWACFHPAMAQQHHPAGHAPAGGHAGGQVPAHMQRQMQQQAQHEMKVYQQQMQQMQKQAQHQYEQDTHRFNQWLKANGGGNASHLPNNPAAFDAWAAKQKHLKAQGKSYDPMYDKFRQFAGANASNNGHHAQNKSGQSQSQSTAANAKGKNGQHTATADAKGKNGGQTAAADAKGKNGGQTAAADAKGKNGGQTAAAGTQGTSSASAKATKKNGATHDAKAAAERKEHAEIKHEERRLDAETKHDERRLAGELRHDERRLAEERRLEAARLAAARTRVPADGMSISMIRNVHSRLQQADGDYHGQRVQAMNSLSRALGHLGTSAPATSNASGNMAQGQSDGILREAIGQLRGVETRLGGLTTNAPHHARAQTSVSEAIGHLEAALRVR